MAESNFGNPDGFKRLFDKIIDEAYKDCQKFKIVMAIEADATQPDAVKISYVLEKVAIQDA